MGRALVPAASGCYPLQPAGELHSDPSREPHGICWVPTADCPILTEAENAAVAHRYTDDHPTNPDGAAALLTDELLRNDCTGNETLTAVETRELNRQFQTAFPDMRVTVQEVVDDGALRLLPGPRKAPTRGR